VKERHTFFETPVTLSPDETVADAIDLINKRSHGALIVVQDKKPVGIVSEADCERVDRFTQLHSIMSKDLVTVPETINPRDAFDFLNSNRRKLAPVVNAKGELVGILTRLGALRATLYTPSLDANKRLRIACAVGINGDVAAKAKELIDAGADVLVVDTAHGHQTRMITAVEQARKAAPQAIIVAGNVVTAGGTRDLINAGANIVKVGVGPGAMCTTRMMTGVGRPQFSAVLECSDEARRTGGSVWADGGVRYPRDVALALAAGAGNVMFGSWLAGTYESAADTMRDPEGRLYKENFGMASNRAVRNRTRREGLFDRARKELFEEGISTSRMYLDPERPGVEDIIDQIVAGVRSSFTYAGAATVSEFRERAVVGIQGSAGYDEGRPVGTSW
jgi:IMP dehydrogenase